MNIAVLGYGTIGSGVVEVIETNGENIKKRSGEEVEVKYVLDLREFPGSKIEKKLTHDFRCIVEDPEVGIIVETMGGVEPAYTYVKEALLKGKSVCTSNKELVAKHGAELLEIARQKKVNFLFEASVGGGIPIIRPLNQSITADEIEEISGIVNGTTNYILTKMSKEGMSFEKALSRAQSKGYAERNPEADVEGYDAGRKLAILSSLAYGKQVDFEDIYMEGITKITESDFKYAEALGAEIKLLASARKNENGLSAMVAPMMIRQNNPLYSVSGVFNAIMITGNMLGNVMFYGAGAGKLPTASAVVSDVVDAIKHKGKNIITIWSDHKLKTLDKGNVISNFFVRVPEEEKEQVKELFADNKAVTLNGGAPVEGEYAFLTGFLPEKEFEEKAKKLNVISRIRVKFED